MKNQFFVEMTDTYGGESNYSWVDADEAKTLQDNYSRIEVF